MKINILYSICLAAALVGCATTSQVPLATSPRDLLKLNPSAIQELDNAKLEDVHENLRRNQIRNGVELNVVYLSIPYRYKLMDKEAFRENWSTQKRNFEIQQVLNSKSQCFYISTSASYSSQVDLTYFHPKIFSNGKEAQAKIVALESPKETATTYTNSYTTYSQIGDYSVPTTNVYSDTIHSAFQYGIFCTDMKLDFDKGVIIMVEPRVRDGLAPYRLGWATTKEALMDEYKLKEEIEKASLNPWPN